MYVPQQKVCILVVLLAPGLDQIELHIQKPSPVHEHCIDDEELPGIMAKSGMISNVQHFVPPLQHFFRIPAEMTVSLNSASGKHSR